MECPNLTVMHWGLHLMLHMMISTAIYLLLCVTAYSCFTQAIFYLITMASLSIVILFQIVLLKHFSFQST